MAIMAHHHPWVVAVQCAQLITRSEGGTLPHLPEL